MKIVDNVYTYFILFKHNFLILNKYLFTVSKFFVHIIQSQIFNKIHLIKFFQCIHCYLHNVQIISNLNFYRSLLLLLMSAI